MYDQKIRFVFVLEEILLFLLKKRSSLSLICKRFIVLKTSNWQNAERSEILFSKVG